MIRACKFLFRKPGRAFFLTAKSRGRWQRIGSCTAVPEETAEPIVDLLNRGVSVVGIAAREDLTAKQSRPEMAPQRLEKIESAPGNGMVSEDWNPQDVVHGRGWPCATPVDEPQG